MQVRKAEKRDKEQINTIYQQAVNYFRQAGIDQWQDGYPNMTTIENDIEKSELYVVTEEDAVLGVTMFSYRPEVTYNQIDNGQWLTSNEQVYGVIHRIAVDERIKGKKIASTLLDYCEEDAGRQDISSLRVDTHVDNLSMQNFLKREGFEYCGEVTMLDGSPRIAFEKMI